MGLIAPWHVGSSWARDWTCVSCIGRWSLHYWTTREAECLCVSYKYFLIKKFKISTSKVCVRPFRSLQMSSYVTVEGHFDPAPSRGGGKLCLLAPTYLARVFQHFCRASVSIPWKLAGHSAETGRLVMLGLMLFTGKEWFISLSKSSAL